MNSATGNGPERNQPGAHRVGVGVKWWKEISRTWRLTWKHKDWKEKRIWKYLIFVIQSAVHSHDPISLKIAQRVYPQEAAGIFREGLARGGSVWRGFIMDTVRFRGQWSIQVQLLGGEGQLGPARWQRKVLRAECWGTLRGGRRAANADRRVNSVRRPAIAGPGEQREEQLKKSPSTSITCVTSEDPYFTRNWGSGHRTNGHSWTALGPQSPSSVTFQIPSLALRIL